MRLDLACWGADLDGYVRNARAAEAAGFSRVWSAELHRSPFVPLAAVAAHTDHIGIGTGVALAFVRSPFATALAALDLDELSGGRFTLGLGSGVRRLVERHHDADFDRPVTRMAETIEIIERVMADAHTGERITVDGDVRSADIAGYRRPHAPVREHISIVVAAVGPQMVRLAGRRADGWLGHELMSPEYLREVILPELVHGDAGSDHEFEVTVSASCSVDPDRSAAYRRAAATVAFYASVKTYEPFFAFHGFGAEAVAVQESFASGNTAAMIDAVPDAMVDAVAIAGTPDEVAERIDRYSELADAIKLGPTTYFLEPEDTQRSVDGIIEAVGALTMEAR